MAKPTPAREQVQQAFLDAAERLLVEVGYAGITTRKLAEEAGANHGLVHYYFGSMEELFVQVLERFTARLIERQRAMYEQPVPFHDKWRIAMGFLEQDLASGYPKIWLELSAMSWNRPELRERVAHVHDEWRAVLTEAFTTAMQEYQLDPDEMPVEAWVSLVMTFNMGMFLERMIGLRDGHQELLDAIDAWLQQKAKGGRKP